MRPHVIFPVALLLVAACAPTHDEPDQKSPADGEPAPSNRVEIPAVVRQNLGITFVPVEVRRVASTIRIPGAFELEPRARREYHMVLSGNVELLVDQFEPVEAGALLYRFRSPRWPELQHEIIEGEQAIGAAEADINVVRARIAEVETTLALARERIESLARSDFKSAALEADASTLAASLPRLAAEQAAAETRLLNARRTRAHALHRAATASGLAEERLVQVIDDEPAYRVIEWIEVRASEAGIVEALHVTNGAFIESPGLVLATVDPTRVRFRALALQADLARLASVEFARIVPPRSPRLGLGEALEADITLGLEAHPEERTLTVIAQPRESRPWGRAGMSAFLEVVVESSEASALAIPRSAVVQDGIRHVFFRRDPKDPNRAIRVEADLGVDDGRWVSIQSGLVRGDEVVLSGAYELKLATEQTTTAKGGHFHADGSFHGDDH